MHIETSDLVLQRAYRWGSERGSAIYMTQPMGGGAVRDYTWARTIDEARRMARHLQSFGFEKGSRIGIVSKNCAHFILSELAIWMAGYVSVAIYPTVNAKTIRYIMEHSESKLLFVGKLDTWDELKQGVPSGIPCISYPLSPKNDFPMWDDIIAKTEPIEGNPTRVAKPAPAPANEKAEDKDKREKAAADDLKRFNDRIAREKALAPFTVLVAKAKLDAVLKGRADLLKKEEKKDDKKDDKKGAKKAGK